MVVRVVALDQYGRCVVCGRQPLELDEDGLPESPAAWLESLTFHLTGRTEDGHCVDCHRGHDYAAGLDGPARCQLCRQRFVSRPGVVCDACDRRK